MATEPLQVRTGIALAARMNRATQVVELMNGEQLCHRSHRFRLIPRISVTSDNPTRPIPRKRCQTSTVGPRARSWSKDTKESGQHRHDRPSR
ncbi:hypothetical protein PSAB6_50117 [Paraburkholderia sabiae]|nr:hypothetical protein PSAB6_50117 [Paraburkholderia sabiae]